MDLDASAQTLVSRELAFIEMISLRNRLFIVCSLIWSRPYCLEYPVATDGVTVVSKVNVVALHEAEDATRKSTLLFCSNKSWCVCQWNK